MTHMVKTGCSHEVDEALFEDFLLAISLHQEAMYEGTPPAIADGISEAAAPGCLRDTGSDPLQRFLAARWALVPRSGGLLVDEAFFVPTSPSRARIGWRRTTSAPSCVAPDWYGALLHHQVADSAGTPKPPAFPELLAAYAASGTAVLKIDRPTGLLDAERLEVEADRVREQLRTLAADRRSLLQRFTEIQQSPRPPDASASTSPARKDLSDLNLWAAQNEDRVVIHSRAMNEAKKSVYARPEEVFLVLECIAGPYRDMKLGFGSRESLDAALSAGPFNLNRSAGEVSLSMHGEYTVQHAGCRLLLDMHIGKGGGFDPRYCLRVYFGWDEHSGRPVIGWLTSHLPNTLT